MLNLKTIRFNFTYLPFKHAIRLPVYVVRGVCFKELKGTIEIPDNTKTFKIRLGQSSVGIFDKKYSRFIWQVSGKVIFKGPAFIGQGCKISVANNGELQFGENVIITAESSIVVHNKVIVGKNSLLSWNILIMDTDFHKILDREGNILNKPAPIIIGEHVWIGCNCTILKKTQIPNNSVIAANTLVNSEILGEDQLIAGFPNKVIKSDIRWEV